MVQTIMVIMVQTIFFPSIAQQNFFLERTISVQADFSTIDNLGSIYTVKNDQLKKFSAQWQQVNLYSSKLLGKISTVDVNNPLKIVLFYKNLSQVLFLDNTLSAEGNAVALETLGLELATLVCSSVNNGIWVYDQRNFQLVRLDQNLKIITQTGNIIQQTGGELNPNFLVEKNNWVYLNDTTRGILVFDIFGTYSKTIPLKNLQSFQIIDENIFFEQEEKFFSLNMKTLEQKEIPLPEQQYKQMLTDGKKLFFLTENELKVYSGK